MPNIEAKAQVVDELRERFEGSPLVILADFKGATVKELDKLRRDVEKGGIKLQVVKNTLCERAVQGTDKEKLGDHFRGNIAVLFSGSDPIAAAKLLRDQLRGNEKFTVKAGFFDGGLLSDYKAIEAVASLPSREDLLSTLLRSIQAGPQQILGVIQGAPRDLMYLLGNYAAKLEDEGQS